MAVKQAEAQEHLHFLLKEDGFRLDMPDAEYGEEIVPWRDRFAQDRWKALYDLGFQEKPAWLDVAGGFLYRVSECFQGMLVRQPDLEVSREQTTIEPDELILARLMDSVPFVLGSEYVGETWIRSAFEHLRVVFADELAAFDGTVAMYLAGKSQKLHVPERIFFHLVENHDEDFPFAFLATYATKDEDGKVRHMPLRYALTEYDAQREKLLELLSCLNRASEASALIGEFVATGEMFHPLRLTSEEAYQFLKDVPAIEEAGIVCRIPNWWRRNAMGVSMSVKLGKGKPTMMGLDTLIGMTPELMVDGVPLTQKEVEELLRQTEGLAFLKGKWVEVDHAKLKSLLEEMEKHKGEISLRDALRMNTGLGEAQDTEKKGPVVRNGEWLSGLLRKLTSPSGIRSVALPKSFHAELRPYQKTGFAWMNYMNELHFGACLADDMGLGKTVQVLAFLEKLRKDGSGKRVLLVVPASLIGNWQKETEKFAPQMPYLVLHGGGAQNLGRLVLESDAFLTITTYQMAVRIQELDEIAWDCLILDEAQAIKNPLAKQTKRVKALKSKMRIAMTGTPIENDLSNLWSLFDFLNKGLLGSSEEFKDYCKRLEDSPEGYAKLKAMISPFMLRRVKTDKAVIADLPDKMEQVEYVSLSRKQVVLYRKYVSELAKKLNDNEMAGIQRQGMVLASLTKLKQICNHPDQYLGQEAYEEKDSGKFGMLRALCETIYEKRERVLVFTQFREIIPWLDAFLAEIFHCKGLALHGGVSVKARNGMVEAFQGEDYVPYMVLSVKAGGTGLNLTRANHVIHFDRWWNPAVENQATDRAYRIGQTNNVMVHKLVCKGTIEEKIDAMIESKKELAANVVGSGGENWITEMSNEELLSILRLE